MDLVEDIRVGQECAEAGVRAEINGPAAILDAREIGRIRVAKFATTEGDEARILLLVRRIFRHLKNHNTQAVGNRGLRTRKIIELPQ